MRGRKEFEEFKEFKEFKEFSAAERRIHPSFQAKTALPTDECEVPSAASLNSFFSFPFLERPRSQGRSKIPQPLCC
jgi:hypothetical protein